MKKVFFLATAAFLITSVSFADTGKKSKKAKSHCSSKSGKSCGKGKAKTAQM